MKRLELIYAFVLLFSLSVSGENNIMYDKANQLYHNKNYDSAAKLYAQMLNDGYCSADLYYNAGNAYYRINKIGLSIWCYEKALQLHSNPNYSDNLLLAKKRIKEPIEEIKDIFFIRWWQSLYTMLSINSWSLLALILFIAAITILFVQKLKPRFNIPRGITSSLFVLSACCLLMLFVSAYNKAYHYQGIIVDAPTLFTNTAKKNPIYLSEGIKVQVLNKMSNQQEGGSNYITVKLPDGRVGTIDSKQMKKL